LSHVPILRELICDEPGAVLVSKIHYCIKSFSLNFLLRPIL
jgi:hypothetical protein